MNNTYNEILKIWSSETPDDFAIFSDFYYQMFGEDFTIPYETDSTKSSFFPYDWSWKISSHKNKFILQQSQERIIAFRKDHLESTKEH